MAPLPPQAQMLATAFRKTAVSGSFTGAEPSKFLYLGLGIIALFKDLLDLVGIGSIIGIGTVVTLCISSLIWILMAVFDRSGGRSNSKMARSLVLIGFSLVEALGFGLNFLPIETFTVVVLYIMARSAWKKESIRLAKEEQAKNLANQAQTYRFQAQIAQQMQREQEAANEAQYQKAA